MYQAIVFLPLLGAILAGIIALAGAHARHPGGAVMEGAENHIDDEHGDEHRGGQLHRQHHCSLKYRNDCFEQRTIH